MRHALNMALQDFEGALIVVSHDRYMLRTVCDQLWLVNNGKVDQFKMDIDDYPKWLAEQKKASEEGSSSATNSNNKISKKKLSAEARKKLQPLQKQLTSLERKIANAEKLKADIHDKLADSDIYSTGKKDELKTLLAQQQSNNVENDTLEEQWFELSEAIEALSNE